MIIQVIEKVYSTLYYSQIRTWGPNHGLDATYIPVSSLSKHYLFLIARLIVGLGDVVVLHQI